MKTLIARTNRTLIELYTGVVVSGVIAWIIMGIVILCAGMGNLGRSSAGLWLGIVLALISATHMYRTLDRALDYDEGSARKLIYKGYYIRYAAVLVIFALLCITQVVNPLLAFLGYMMLKIGAFMQPLTHKIYNKLLHESDPVPQSLEELEKAEAE